MLQQLADLMAAGGPLRRGPYCRAVCKREQGRDVWAVSWGSYNRVQQEEYHCNNGCWCIMPLHMASHWGPMDVLEQEPRVPRAIVLRQSQSGHSSVHHSILRGRNWSVNCSWISTAKTRSAKNSNKGVTGHEQCQNQCELFWHCGAQCVSRVSQIMRQDDTGVLTED